MTITKQDTIIGTHGALTDLRYDGEDYHKLWFTGSLESKLLFAVSPELIPMHGPDACEYCGSYHCLHDHEAEEETWEQLQYENHVLPGLEYQD